MFEGFFLIDLSLVRFSIILMYAEEAIVVCSLVGLMKPMMYVVIPFQFINIFFLLYIFMRVCWVPIGLG